MLQLKHIQLITQLTGCLPSEIKALKFGRNVPYTTPAASVPLTMGTFYVPDNSTLIVLRVQSYMVNTDNADVPLPDYNFYRAMPRGLAKWVVQNPEGPGPEVDWTSPLADVDLMMDVDEFLLFPANINVKLIFTPFNNPPAIGTWYLRNLVFAYLVNSKVSDVLGTPQSWVFAPQ